MTVGSILKSAFAREKAKRYGLSMRSLAGRMNVSTAFLSKVMSDKTMLPWPRLEELARHLRLDNIEVKNLKSAFAQRRLPEIELASISDHGRSVQGYSDLTDEHFPVLEKWYYSVILDLSTCSDFQCNATWLCTRLEITRPEAEAALARLIELGYLVKENGRYTKFKGKIRFPMHSSHPEVRKVNREILLRAVQLLSAPENSGQYAHRLLASVSVAVNPDRIAEGIARFHASLFDIANFMTEGECTEVFTLSAIALQATKPRRKK